jgi:hypothetical protein
LKKPSKDSVSQAAKTALSWTKDTAAKAKDKSRESLDRAYESKKPLAEQALAQLRSENPKANPTKIQALLDDALRSAEEEYGTSSVEFSSTVSLYVFTSLEIHGFDEDVESKHQKLIDLMVVLDSSAGKVARKAVGVAANIVMLLPQGRAVRGVALAQKAVAGAAAAKNVLAQSKIETKVADTVIARTTKILGPAPKTWKSN